MQEKNKINRHWSTFIGEFYNLEGYETPEENFLFSSETIVKSNNGNEDRM